MLTYLSQRVVSAPIVGQGRKKDDPGSVQTKRLWEFLHANPNRLNQ
jgi:hypothetical protein